MGINFYRYFSFMNRKRVTFYRKVPVGEGEMGSDLFTFEKVFSVSGVRAEPVENTLFGAEYGLDGEEKIRLFLPPESAIKKEYYFSFGAEAEKYQTENVRMFSGHTEVTAKKYERDNG